MLPAGRTFIEWLSSTRLSIILFGLLIAAAIPGTLLESQREYYNNPAFRLLLLAFALHLAFCTYHRWKTLSRSTLVVHLGVLITIVGAVMTGMGYVATINIYEGESSKTVFRWDLDQDTPFSHEIRVKKIHVDLAPVPLKIGIMKGAEKHALKILKTGESFTLDSYSIKLERFDPFKEAVTISLSQGTELLGTAEVPGISSLPADFPYSFTLVAFKRSLLNRSWLDLELLENGHVVTSGTTEINHPFHWNGIDFFNTSINQDKDKRPYAGLQIVKDPGKHVVYSGMIILSIGTIAAWYRRFKR